MVVCKYYMQGSCTFGDRCRNEHPQTQRYSDSSYRRGGGARYMPDDYGDEYYEDDYYDDSWNNRSEYRSTNSSRQDGGRKQQQYDSYHSSNASGQARGPYQNKDQNRYKWLKDEDAGDNRSEPKPGYLDTSQREAASERVPDANRESSIEDILLSISQDMETWESSRMWPFSSYGYTKDEASVPGFDDLSFEEVRLEAIQCTLDGSLPTFNQRMRFLLRDCNEKRQEFKNQRTGFKQKLVHLIEDNRKKTAHRLSHETGLVFGEGTGSDGGGGQDSIFGGQQSITSSLFGKGDSTAAGNVFGDKTGQAVTHAVGLFGKPVNTGLFGGAAAASQSSEPTNAGSLFGKPVTTGLFGGAAAASQSSEPTNAGSLFGKPVNTGLFGGAAAPSQSREPATAGTLFGKPVPVTNQSEAFSFSDNNNAVRVPESSAVRPGVHSASQPAGQVFSSRNAVFTLLIDLTLEEKHQFESKTFTFGKIPARPPPREFV